MVNREKPLKFSTAFFMTMSCPKEVDVEIDYNKIKQVKEIITCNGTVCIVLHSLADKVWIYTLIVCIKKKA